MRKNILKYISIIINIILIILLIYINNSKKTTYPKYGYFVNKELDITNRDILEHNAPFEYYYIGEHNNKETIGLIPYIAYINSINYDNEEKIVNISFNGKIYKIISDEDIKELQKEIEENKGEYFINLQYSSKTGYIYEIVLTKL